MKWVTKDGRELEPAQMDYLHLKNTVQYLRRRESELRREALDSLPSFSGEMAQMSVEHEMSRISKRSFLPPIYAELVLELEKRDGSSGWGVL